MKEKLITIKQRTELIGIGEAAKRIGVSRTHLSLVVRGLRESKRTLKALEKANVKIEL